MPIVKCKKCRNEKVHMAKGLCSKCYRRAERSAKSKRMRSNGGIDSDQKRMLSAFNRILGGASDLDMSRKDILTIKDILGPYLEDVAEYLEPARDIQEERDS